MSRTIQAQLVRYGYDGEYLSRPVALNACMVMDEDNGVLLEIVLPHLADSTEEREILVSASELRKIVVNPVAGICIPGQ